MLWLATYYNNSRLYGKPFVILYLEFEKNKIVSLIKIKIHKYQSTNI
jgi:hypothetical protein